MKGGTMYQQLTPEKRYMLSALKQEGCSMRKIGEHIGVHYSTISRELCRNHSTRGYRPATAQRKAMSRRQQARKPEKLTPEVKHLLSSYLKKHWSPEQIAGRLKLEGILEISHETIYKYIRNNKDNGGQVYKCLRRKKPYRKKYGSLSRHALDSRISIDERPKIVDNKSRIGDWEVDTIVSRQDKAVLVTLVDRMSKYTLIGMVENKGSMLVAKRITSLFRKQKSKVHTITADNGNEFACHQRISKHLNADFFFAHPYSSWERGLNENTNGLIRQYFPKKTSLKNITRDRLKQVMSNINNRPRKTLGYRTPKEVFKSQGVALDG